MTFEVTYTRNGKSYTTNVSDDNILLTIPMEGYQNVIKLMAVEDIVIESARVIYEHKYQEYDTLFCNGYQSWTDTREFGINDKLNNLKQIPGMLQKMYSFKNYGDYAFYEYQKNVLHGHDVAYIRGKDNVFIGNNNFKFAGLIIEFHVSKDQIIVVNDINHYPVKQYEEITIFDFDYQVFRELAEVTYFDKFKPRASKKILGYSSWYNHFDKIDESIVFQNINAIDHRYDFFQIDDGWQSKVGDWLECDKVKFPNGLKDIAAAINKKDIMPGLWLAPYVAQEDSKLVTEHPDWLKQVDGKPLRCGGNWGGFYALDFYNPEVQDYVRTFLQHYRDMGFKYFKLDFLYAVSLPDYEGKNRTQVARDAYLFLRECLGEDAIMSGNGALMAPAFEAFDYVRVGCSVTTEFDDSFIMRKMHRERNSTKNTILNTIYRHIFNGKVFQNDPDVFLLRDDNMKMNSNQKYSLAMINALFGSVLTTSDDIYNYHAQQKNTFDRILYIFKNAKKPVYRKRGDFIEISYELDGKSYNVTYDSINGILKEADNNY